MDFRQLFCREDIYARTQAEISKLSLNDFLQKNCRLLKGNPENCTSWLTSFYFRMTVIMRTFLKNKDNNKYSNFDHIVLNLNPFSNMISITVILHIRLLYKLCKSEYELQYSWAYCFACENLSILNPTILEHDYFEGIALNTRGSLLTALNAALFDLGLSKCKNCFGFGQSQEASSCRKLLYWINSDCLPFGPALFSTLVKRYLNNYKPYFY